MQYRFTGRSTKVAFTKQTEGWEMCSGKLKLVCVCERQKKISRQTAGDEKKFFSILANMFHQHFGQLVNSYLTCKRFANMCW